MNHPYLSWQSRTELPHLLNSLGLVGTGVEVGVQWAQNFSHIRANWKGEMLIGVDPWKAYYGIDVTDARHEEIHQHARNAMASFNSMTWRFMRMTSVEAATQLAKEIAGGRAPLDFVYLDGDHDYVPIIEELHLWWPLIKPGGIIAGHDWIIDGWHLNEQPFTTYETKAQLPKNSHGQCGPFFVRKAVKDFFTPLGLHDKLAVTSPETDLGWQSWLIQKPA